MSNARAEFSRVAEARACLSVGSDDLLREVAELRDHAPFWFAEVVVVPDQNEVRSRSSAGRGSPLVESVERPKALLGVAYSFR